MQLWSARIYVILLAFSFAFTVDGQRVGAIRLVNGANEDQGRVEIFAHYTWGTVCHDYWGTSDAKVVCRQLGYTGLEESSYHTYAYFGEGTGPIHLDNVQCTGSEEKLIDCASNAIGSHNCAHYKDAGVTCACSSTPDCLKAVEECPYFRTEIVTVPHRRCPICRCASCPIQPKCPTNCKSGETVYYDGEVCRRCKCVPQELPDIIEEPNSISVGMLAAVGVVMLGIPVVLLIIVLIFRQNKKKTQTKSKASKEKEDAMEGPRDIF